MRTVIGLLVLILCTTVNGYADGLHVVRTYPLSQATEIPTGSQIGITFESPLIGRDSITIHVTGNLAGDYRGMQEYSADRRTLIFESDGSFLPFEHISVSVLSAHKVIYSFSFQTMQGAPQSPATQNSNLALTISPLNEGTWQGLMPRIDASPTAGQIFLSVSGSSFGGLLVLDEHGILLHSAAREGICFERQPNGMMTYFDGAAKTFFGLDSNMNVIDTFRCANGYETDPHEMIMLPDGSYLLLGVTQTPVDASQHGGSSNAIAVGNVLQRFDRDGKLVFEWRGIDHYDPFDAIGLDFTGASLDVQHANSIDIDSNGDYLISNRNLSEITKISAETGKIIWRLGGKRNQFAFTNDSLAFDYQHCARFLPNGHILLFDNGNHHPTPESRAVEYVLDTQRMSATRVWEFRHNPPVVTPACGSVQRFPNGNTFIGWGLQGLGPMSPSTGMTEVRQNGSVVSDFNFLPMLFSYRAMKYPALLAVHDAPNLISPLRGDSLMKFSCKWHRSSGVDSFELAISTDSAFGNLAYSLNTRDTAIATKALLPGTYYWHVRGLSQDDVTAWSETREFTLLPLQGVLQRAGEDPLLEVTNSTITVSTVGQTQLEFVDVLGRSLYKQQFDDASAHTVPRPQIAVMIVRLQTPESSHIWKLIR